MGRGLNLLWVNDDIRTNLNWAFFTNAIVPIAYRAAAVRGRYSSETVGTTSSHGRCALQAWGFEAVERHAKGERIVAVGLLTQPEVELLGVAFDRLWPVNETTCFTGLLDALDNTDRELRLSQNAEPPQLRPSRTAGF